MTKKEVVVLNKSGIHARPAALIVQTAGQFSSEIQFARGEDRVNAKSILGVIALGASYNTRLVVEAEGTDEKEAIEAIAAVFTNKFSTQ